MGLRDAGWTQTSASAAHSLPPALRFKHLQPKLRCLLSRIPQQRWSVALACGHAVSPSCLRSQLRKEDMEFHFAEGL